MKKIGLLLLLVLVSSPAFCFERTPFVKNNIMILPQNTAANAFFAGASMASGRLNLNSTPTLRVLNLSLSYLDPYVISAGGKNYILITDRKDDNWSVENILGYDDNRDDLFGALKKLESDGDNDKITKDELKKAGIRFALLNSDGSVALDDRELDYDLEKVLYIDMKNLRTALGNKNQDGTFGYFYVIVKDGGKKRALNGRVTFEEKKELQRYIN